jgi:hypothetical protein
MTTKTLLDWRCSRTAGGDFPVIATITGVSSCFAEALLKKHSDLGAPIELTFAGLQAVPLPLVMRYFVVRRRQQSGPVATNHGV